MENAPPARKPQAARLGWEILAARHAYESPVNRLRADRLAIPGRGEIEYSYLERGESVIVVPVTADGRLALIRQYRYPVDEHCLEFPAGCCVDSGGLALEDVARKELREEIGAKAASFEYVNWFYSSSSISDEVCHVILARGVVLDQAPEQEPGENIELVLRPVDEVLALVRRGEMKTGTCALAILLCEGKLRGEM